MYIKSYNNYKSKIYILTPTGIYLIFHTFTHPGNKKCLEGPYFSIKKTINRKHLIHNYMY